MRLEIKVKVARRACSALAGSWLEGGRPNSTNDRDGTRACCRLLNPAFWAARARLRAWESAKHKRGLIAAARHARLCALRFADSVEKEVQLSSGDIAFF